MKGRSPLLGVIQDILTFLGGLRSLASAINNGSKFYLWSFDLSYKSTLMNSLHFSELNFAARIIV